MSTVAATIKLADPDHWAVVSDWGQPVSPFLALALAGVNLVAATNDPAEAARLWGALESHAARLRSLAEMQVVDGAA